MATLMRCLFAYNSNHWRQIIFRTPTVLLNGHGFHSRLKIIHCEESEPYLWTHYCTMSQARRYFVNRYPDYAGGEVKIDQEITKKRCLNYLKTIINSQGTIWKDCEGGVYVGVAGVAYACYYVAQHPSFEEHKQEILRHADEFITAAVAYVNHPGILHDVFDKPSFFLGAAGVFAVAAVICDMLGKIDERNSFVNQYIDLADICLPILFLKCGSDELFVGRAGYLCGILFLHKTFRTPVFPRERIFALCQKMVNSGREYSKEKKSKCPLMYAYYGTEYLGAAHGLSSILQILMSFPDYLDSHPEAERYVKESVDFMLKLQAPSGNFVCSMEDLQYRRHENDELVHWCHGAPGIVYMMAKAYQRWNDQKYLQSCLACGEVVWTKGLLKKGPGICHGVAGNGYVFLLLYRLTSDPKHLYRASKFAEFLFHDKFSKARTPDKPYSLFEGLSGTVCFLSDLLQPDKAKFPFFDVM